MAGPAGRLVRGWDAAGIGGERYLGRRMRRIDSSRGSALRQLHQDAPELAKV